MTEHKATPEQWVAAEHFGNPGRTPRPLDAYACLLELRARVEALEADRRTILGTGSRLRVGLDAAEPAESNYPAEPDSSLVERVHSCIVGEPECGHMQARAAIREVAAWMTSNPDHHFPPALVFALEREAER